MLVLSRKVDEQVIIGGEIRITVVSIRGNQVRLGFEAPPSVPIFREELRQEPAPHSWAAALVPEDCEPSEQPASCGVSRKG